MKNKAKKLIRNILIGAVASLYSTNTQAKESATVSFLDNLNDDDKKDAVNALKNKIFRNVLQITKKGDIKHRLSTQRLATFYSGRFPSTRLRTVHTGLPVHGSPPSHSV